MSKVLCQIFSFHFSFHIKTNEGKYKQITINQTFFKGQVEGRGEHTYAKWKTWSQEPGLSPVHACLWAVRGWTHALCPPLYDPQLLWNTSPQHIMRQLSNRAEVFTFLVQLHFHSAHQFKEPWPKQCLPGADLPQMSLMSLTKQNWNSHRVHTNSVVNYRVKTDMSNIDTVLSKDTTHLWIREPIFKSFEVLPCF